MNMKRAISLSVYAALLVWVAGVPAQNPIQRARTVADALEEASAPGFDPVAEASVAVPEEAAQPGASTLGTNGNGVIKLRSLGREDVAGEPPPVVAKGAPVARETDESSADEQPLQASADLAIESTVVEAGTEASAEPEPASMVTQAPEVAVAAEAPVIEETAPPSQETVEYVEFKGGPATTGVQKITINLDNVSLEDTVRMFAQTAGANIIAAPNLFTGRFVSVSLNDVDWIPALRSILEIHNFSLVERTPGSGMFAIQPRGADTPEPTQIKTFFLNYATAGEMHDSVEKMLKPGRTNELKAMKFQSRNALVVRSTESNLGELQNLIKELDVPGRQILIEAKIMELSDEASKQLGIRWDSLEAFNVEAGLGPFTRTEKSEDKSERTEGSSRSEQGYLVNYNRVYKTPDGQRIDQMVEYDSAGTPLNPILPTINNYDYELAQNAEGDRSVARVNRQGYTPGRERFDYSEDYAGSSQNALDSFTKTITREKAAILELDTLKLVLSALEKTDGVSVVSNPKMIVTSGSTNAFFRVGEREPIIRKEVIKGTEESPGDTIVAKLDTEIETDFIRGGYLETGIDLGVIATVKTADFIEAYIRPVLRRMIGQKEVEGNSWPIISVKEIGTSFTLRSGQTVAIGGLTDTQDSKAVSKVPFLGDLPLLGRFFSHTKDVKKQVETIIFVTLSVADPNNLERVAGVPENSRLVHDRLLLADAEAAERAAAATNSVSTTETKKKSRSKSLFPRK